MGFAQKWAAISTSPSAQTYRDTLDTMDTNRSKGTPRVNSVHTVHIVPRGSTPEGQASASPHLAELDRFFASAVEHQFPDGTTGWVAPKYLPELQRKAKRGWS
jgi:hypothetical protein